MPAFKAHILTVGVVVIGTIRNILYVIGVGKKHSTLEWDLGSARHGIGLSGSRWVQTPRTVI